MARELMKGNEALAEACLRAGCRFFSGYPITPQTEILEYLSWRMEEVGALSISGPSQQFSGDYRKELAVKLKETVARIQVTL